MQRSTLALFVLGATCAHLGCDGSLAIDRDGGGVARRTDSAPPAPDASGLRDAQAAAPDGRAPIGTIDGAAAMLDGAAALDGAAVRDGAAVPSSEVRIVFPLPSTTDAERVRVRVRIERVDDDESVVIAGIAATASDGDFVAEVPLAIGANAIEASVGRAGAVARTANVVIVRAAAAGELSRGRTAWDAQRGWGLVVAADESEALFGEDIYDGVARIDVATGDHAWLACTEADSLCTELGGSGVDLVQPTDVDYLPEVGVLLVTDQAHLVEVSLATHGTRTLSGRGIGSGTAFSRAASTVWDARRSAAVTLDWDTSLIFRTDLASGDRTVLSGGSTGSGPEIRAAEALAYDGARDRALFFQQYVSPLYAVDLETGARSVVSDEARGAGPTLGDPASITVDAERDRAFAWDDEVGALVAIELVTGDRRVVASPSLGRGPFPRSAMLAFGRDLVFARDESTLYAIDPSSGDRVVISR
jgi:hypothetical protein